MPLAEMGMILHATPKSVVLVPEREAPSRRKVFDLRLPAVLIVIPRNPKQVGTPVLFEDSRRQGIEIDIWRQFHVRLSTAIIAKAKTAFLDFAVRVLARGRPDDK